MTDLLRLSPDVAFHDFYAKLKECSVKAVCKREYVLVSRLVQWLKSLRPGEQDSQLTYLLRVTYSQRVEPGLLIDAERVCNSNQSAVLVFSILLELGHGNLIDDFQRYSILDRCLPISLWDLRDKLSRFVRTSDVAEDVAVRFNVSQWRYCPATFDDIMRKVYEKDRIIPICARFQINEKGGTADLWQIVVHEEFVGKELRKRVEYTRDLPRGPDAALGYRYTFALKSFHEGNKHIYDKEVEAFAALKYNDGIVKYLGDYGHPRFCQPETNEGLHAGNNGRETFGTHNILLEYGDYDLDEYFAQRLPPVVRTGIEDFWRSLFEVADAIEGIHNLNNNDGAVQHFYGWHADIKPDNILNVQGKFKLADLGFAVFVAKSGADPNKIVMGGTETYGAPECRNTETSLPVSQTIDVWSLGCVFSVAATWVVLGYQGIQQFDKLRRKAKKMIWHSPRSSKQRDPPPDDVDWFHDGRSVLPDVIEWHSALRGFARKTDNVTSQVLDLVEEHMLVQDPMKRLDVKAIYTSLKNILSRSRTISSDEIPESIRTVLLEVDEAAPSFQNSSQGPVA
ncbi:hypothetical protein MMC25_001726 [Agyrium rufum]|nr:hypothetical protein [Agyrium rufum]